MNKNTTIISTKRIKELQSSFFKKSHRLVFSQLSLSPVEHDILALFLSRLHADHWEPFLNHHEIHSPTYIFSSEVLMDWFDLEKTALYPTLMLPANRLSKKAIGLKNDETEKFEFTTLFKRIAYENGHLIVIPNDLLIEEYLSLSGGHSQVPHRTFRNIKQDHAKRLYTMLCRFRNNKFSVFHPLTIDDLHAYFGLLDEQGNLLKKTYEKTAKFVQFILKPSIELIDDHEPNIEFFYADESKKHYGFEFIKKGRKVVAIKFLFRWNQSKQIAKDESDERNELANTPSPYLQAELTYTLVSEFVSGQGGNPTLQELNNMMSMSPKLAENGYQLDAAFMSNFTKAMTEALANNNAGGHDSMSDNTTIEHQ
ncbi:replication initiation protein [Shewanella aestuarii]|uniref:Replication initiation protein n=1 Tax=Shewanella aestuarii TaxID=1028752 RepID=A0A6G9QRB7_9GAMM|nr:replication initiation protein [Shewanella aestuarii]QIR16643.1 replication initiation protein [Shewanella aestuarii]